jgi:hypothetical protein
VDELDEGWSGVAMSLCEVATAGRYEGRKSKRGRDWDGQRRSARGGIHGTRTRVALGGAYVKLL